MCVCISVICVYVCMYVCMYVCVCMPVCLYVCMYLCMFVCMGVYGMNALNAVMICMIQLTLKICSLK